MPWRDATNEMAAAFFSPTESIFQYPQKSCGQSHIWLGSRRTFAVREARGNFRNSGILAASEADDDLPAVVAGGG
jgi:hypothetical protein